MSDLPARQELLGKGAHGAVYRALWNGQEVAMKVLAHHLREDERRMEAFEKEAEVLEGLEHERVVRMLAHDLEDGYILMEYVVLALVLKPLKIKIGSRWGTKLDSEQVLSILILGVVLNNMSKGDEKLYRLCTFIGMGLWVFVGVII